MSKLFTPLQINQLKLTNRIVLPPLANNLADHQGQVTDKLIQYYINHCRGIGLVIVEHTYVKPSGRINNHQLGIYDDSCIKGLSELAMALHASGTKCGIQLTHAGASAKAELMGQQPVAPSAISHPRDGGMPRAISLFELDHLIEDFVFAARRGKEAGFDMVEIHGAHGYLLNQFLSPYTNRRTDLYGGSLENRLRLSLEIVQAVRNEVGKDYPIFYRLGADDGFEGGLTLAEGAEAAQVLAQAGVNVLDLTGGLLGFRVKSGNGFFVYLAEKIKPMVSVPVLVTGGITTAQLAEEILRQGKADLVGIGRAMLANPNWAIEASLEL